MQGALFNLEAWKAFNMVAMKGSMNKAAAELLSDVSTVSRRIDALEKELGLI
jgi:DNA-binding transcriptional LysR family regulator